MNEFTVRIGDVIDGWRVDEESDKHSHGHITYSTSCTTCGGTRKIRKTEFRNNKAPKCTACRKTVVAELLKTTLGNAVKDSKTHTFEEYQERALKTESILRQDTPIDMPLLWILFRQAILNGELLNQYKRALYYGKPQDESVVQQSVDGLVTLLQQRTPDVFKFQPNVPSAVDLRVIHMVIGMATEVTELMQTILKAQMQGGFLPEDIENMEEESGDGEWYRAGFYKAMGFDEKKIQKGNMAKLAKRYGNSFSTEKAVNRDTTAEMDAMRGAMQ